MEFYSSKTKEVLNIPKKERKKNGLFPTPKKTVDFVLSKLNIKKDDFVLEPSFGTGEFLIPIKKKSDNVYGVELLDYVYEDFGNCFNEDFLTWGTDLKFDFIIGNPPFFETTKYRELFPEVCYGRTNIYSFFIKKSIDLLKENGKIVFITPKTINTGKYFYKLRNYIAEHTDIVEMSDIEDFDNVSQDLQVLILEKKKNSGNFIVKKQNSVIFSNDFIYLNDLISNYKTIKDLGFEVKTGSFIWNENRELLSYNPNNTLLVWNGNIKRFKLVPVPRKKQRVRLNSIHKAGIVSNRVFSKELNFCLVEEPFLAENHVNVIINRENEISYKQLIEIIEKSGVCNYAKFFSDSTQISKNELEEMPLWGVTKEIGLIK